MEFVCTKKGTLLIKYQEMNYLLEENIVKTKCVNKAVSYVLAQLQKMSKLLGPMS
jgi:hypothetical protein